MPRLRKQLGNLKTTSNVGWFAKPSTSLVVDSVRHEQTPDGLNVFVDKSQKARFKKELKGYKVFVALLNIDASLEAPIIRKIKENC